MIFFWDRKQDIHMWLKGSIYVRRFYLNSIEKILNATCYGGDMVLVFGCELDFPLLHLHRR